MRKRTASFLGVVLVSLFAALPSHAAPSDFSGSWTGAVTGVLPCARGGSATEYYTATGPFVQNGASVSATLTLTGPEDSCKPGSPLVSADVMLSGTVSDSTLKATFAVREVTGDVNASVNGSFMKIVFSSTTDKGFLTLSGNLTRTSSPLAIESFTATPAAIVGGTSSTLSWAVASAPSMAIDNGVGTIAANGTVSVAPTRTTTYTLTASNGVQTVTATATVTVASGARVSAGSFPAGLAEQENVPGASDVFTLVNSGDTTATVTLTGTGGFFTVSPNTATIPPNGTIFVQVVGIAKPAGAYTGSVSVSVDGKVSLTVPVRLLVTAPPKTEALPAPTAARFEVSAPEGQNPTGTTTFTNTGSSEVQAVAVADVPWLIPTTDLIKIQPGQSASVPFTIDRSKRNDDAVAGAAGANLSLVFLNAAGSSADRARTLATTSASRVSVSVADVVKPAVGTGIAPALGKDEVAIYVPGCGTAPPVKCDLFLSPKTSVSVPDIRLFLVSSGQQATFPAIEVNRAVAVPAATTSVFGVENPGTSLMLRSTSAPSLSVGAIRQSSVSGALAYLTAFPVFRSDRGIAGGDKLTLAGVERTANTSTTVVVQELSGNPATVELQGYDAVGAAVGDPVKFSVPGFEGRTDGAVTTLAGAASVVVRNTSTGPALINAYARVQDSRTSDMWTIVDPKTREATTSTTLYMPLPKAPLPADVRIFTTNSSPADPVDVVTDTIAPPTPRRRAVVHGGTSAVKPETSISIGPLQTSVRTISANAAFVRIISEAGALSASARLTMTLPGGNTFGTELPVVPDTAAIAPTESKRFVGADDSSAETFAAKATGSSRLSLVLIETSGIATTLRVTLRFASNGARTVTQQSAAQTYTVSPGANLIINDLCTSVIGAQQRASFGDLRNLQIDIDVLTGGKILPFLESVDGATNDVTMRTPD